MDAAVDLLLGLVTPLRISLQIKPDLSFCYTDPEGNRLATDHLADFNSLQVLSNRHVILSGDTLTRCLVSTSDADCSKFFALLTSNTKMNPVQSTPGLLQLPTSRSATW
jgi:hypothetical protein